MQQYILDGIELTLLTEYFTLLFLQKAEETSESHNLSLLSHCVTASV